MGLLTLTYRGLAHSIDVDSDTTLRGLTKLIQEATGAKDCSIKLLVPGRKALLLPEDEDYTQPDVRLAEAGERRRVRGHGRRG